MIAGGFTYGQTRADLFYFEPEENQLNCVVHDNFNFQKSVTDKTQEKTVGFVACGN